jgi:hypothetical protein
MKIYTLSLALIGSCLLSIGCSNSGTQHTQASTGGTPTPTPVHVQVGNSAEPVAPSGNTKTADGEVPAAGRGKQRIDVNPSATPLPPRFQKAPENSEFASGMDRDGNVTEIRVFKGHPQLDRVETKWTDPKKKAVKFVLKNGKTIEISTDRLGNLATTLAKDLVALSASKTMRPPSVKK